MAHKQSVCAVGIGSMLLILVAFLAAKPVTGSEVQPVIDFVLVEEYPDYVTEDRKVRLQQDAGVDQPAPKHAGMTFLIKKSGGGEPTIRYIDERGWANAVHRDGDGNYYFMLRDDVSDEHIYMKPDGRFPYIEIGKRENAVLAESVLAHSKSVTPAQLDQCLEQVKREMVDPSFLSLTASPLAADEEQVRDAPRRGLVFSSRTIARDHWGDLVPAKVSCYFRIQNGEVKFTNAYLSPPTVKR